MTSHFLIAIADWRVEHVIACFQTGAHFLDDLTAVLLALKLALGRENGLDELAFRCLLKVEVQAFTPSAAPLHFLAQFEVKLRITRKSLEIVEDNDKILIRLRIEECEKRHHARALQKITPAGHVIRKDSDDIITMLGGILTATMFLAIETRPLFRLAF
ncbi:MAG: hypothetical protein AAGI89_09910 [Pseudomonadota bacterium]